jgi:hypothetical protein
VVGLAAANVSLNTGTVQVGWGEPLETPLLAQYIFRQLPGQPTQLIGASSVKHFFSTVSADFQHLNPNETDPYGSSLNTQQSQYSYGSEIDPVTGTLHSQVGRGHLSNDNMVVLDNRTFTDRIQYLLQVNVADLDPAQNPAGTRWFLMGNLFVDGEQDVSQASRWLEIVPHFNGTTFSFTYPNGSGGQLDFRTIPGLSQPNGGATFVTTDATTQGNWQGVYGADGYHVIDDTVNYPSYAQALPSGQLDYVWASSSADDVRTLTKGSDPTDRLAATWYSATSFTLDLNLTDGQTHQVAFYLLDFDMIGRSEQIDVLDASSGAVLDSQTASDFGGGEYLVWNLTGHVQVRFTNLAGDNANAVLSGIFFG